MIPSPVPGILGTSPAPKIDIYSGFFATILYFTDDEVPHGVGVEIIAFKEPRYEGGTCNIEANIYCEKNSHKGILIGKNGAMLKKIGTASRKDIERLTGYKINLKLWVKVKKDWRDSDTLLKNYGYRDEM